MLLLAWLCAALVGCGGAEDVFVPAQQTASPVAQAEAALSLGTGTRVGELMIRAPDSILLPLIAGKSANRVLEDGRVEPLWTGISLINHGNTQNTVHILYVDERMGGALAARQVITLAPQDSISIPRVDDITNMVSVRGRVLTGSPVPTTFQGSAIVTTEGSSPTTVEAMVNLMRGNQEGGSSYNGLRPSGSRAIAPVVQVRNGDSNARWNSILTYQNPTPGPLTFRVRFDFPGGPIYHPALGSAPLRLEAGQSRSLDAWRVPGLPTGAVAATGIVEGPASGGPLSMLVGTVLQFDLSRRINAASMFSEHDGSNTVLAPIIQHNWFGFWSGTAVTNVGSVPAQVEMKFVPGPGSTCTDASARPGSRFATIAPGSSHFFVTVEMFGDCVLNGSGRITSTGAPIVALVNHQRPLATWGYSSSTYEAFGLEETSSQFVLPLVMADNYGYFSGVQVANAEATPRTVRLRFSRPCMGRTEQVGVVPAHGVLSLVQDPPNWPCSGWVSSGVLTADDAGARLAVTVNLLGTNDKQRDPFHTYKGMKTSRQTGKDRCPQKAATKAKLASVNIWKWLEPWGAYTSLYRSFPDELTEGLMYLPGLGLRWTDLEDPALCTALGGRSAFHVNLYREREVRDGSVDLDQFRGSLVSCWYCESYKENGADMHRWVALYGAKRVVPPAPYTREWTSP
ncbi:hypothetical protein LXT21_25730 [Myxococcus sp. K38C18041901]|uniref:hypothetical protein n=1 Tax=Myxococcus guangdongensis TaxID=2906760 RepID=UPI0020A7A847|nr:hypothetical protein [Myxococcus guangdongensis]MCP3062194.1 hypothetical protein [Myxococcus guangdongensis]